MFAPMLLATLDLPRPHVAEDAPALAMVRHGTGLIAVFDGLGGAGARLVNGEHGRRSSAYYAARLAHDVAVKRFATDGLRMADAPDVLTGAIGDALALRHAATPPAAGTVRSRLLRSYPTTAALMSVEPGWGYVQTRAMWAGDSRCYALTPEAGLQQLSRDDSAGSTHPMQAMREDDRMTNVLCADGSGRLRVTTLRINGPALLIVATDGGYGCFPSPMHFELVLLDALAGSGTCENWSTALAARLSPLADDDVSLAATFTGWPSVAAAALSFAGRREELRALLDAPIAEAWERYRPGYLAFSS